MKRPISEGVALQILARSPRTKQMPCLLDANHDMDTYMADQGGDDIGTLTLTPSTTPSYASVPPADKLPLIDDLKRKNMVLGETWYLVSSEWWKRWRKACTGEVDKRGPISEADLGPVNNSSLLDEYSHLRSPIVEGMDVEYVPEEAWNLLVTWYIYPLSISADVPKSFQVRHTDHPPSPPSHRPRTTPAGTTGAPPTAFQGFTTY